MQASPGFICDRRTRCKHCLGFPEYITNLASLQYHNPEWSGGRGHNRGVADRYTYRFKDEIEYDLNHLMRWNSQRGTASISSYKMKNQKDQWGGYRQVVSCKCGLSLWMYPGPTSNKNFLNRKKHISITHYRRRHSLEGMINSAGYTW